MGLKHTLDVASAYGYVKRIVDLKIQILSFIYSDSCPSKPLFFFLWQSTKEDIAECPRVFAFIMKRKGWKKERKKIGLCLLVISELGSLSLFLLKVSMK